MSKLLKARLQRTQVSTRRPTYNTVYANNKLSMAGKEMGGKYQIKKQVRVTEPDRRKNKRKTGKTKQGKISKARIEESLIVG